nr:type ISP restriction/modification enzyme [Alicyclobacillus acidocaldarius]
MGNPPWRSRQRDENDANQNLQYERLDERIRSTFAAETSSRNRNSLYDAYIRAIRWAMDRVGNQGVVAFVTNAGWIDGNAMDGMRKELANECAAIYLINLRGNARTQGELRRREGDNVFSQGSRAAVCLVVLVKDDSHVGPAEIFYHDIGDYLSREEKLAKVKAFGDVQGVPWTRITPNEAGDWIHQRSDEFVSLMPLGGEQAESEHRIFNIRSRGVATSRDAWVYNFSHETVANNMQRMIAVYNSQVRRGINEQLNDPSQISWSRGLRRDATRGGDSWVSAGCDSNCVVPSVL